MLNLDSQALSLTHDPYRRKNAWHNLSLLGVTWSIAETDVRLWSNRDDN